MELYCKVPHDEEYRVSALVQLMYEKLKEEYLTKDISFGVKRCKRNSIVTLRVLPFCTQQEDLSKQLTTCMLDVCGPYNNKIRAGVWFAYGVSAGYTKGKWKKLTWLDF